MSKGLAIFIGIFFPVSFLMILFAFSVKRFEENFDDKSELVDMEFSVTNVSLVHYSCVDSLNGFTYLLTPNGKVLQVNDFQFYETMKHHIGQKVILRINREFKEDRKTHEKKFIKDSMPKPPVVVQIKGEALPYEDRVQEVFDAGILTALGVWE